MKLQGTAGKLIKGGNAKELQLGAGFAASTTDYGPLLQIIAEVFDELAEGRDMYLILGATSNRSAFVCTVKDNGVPTSVYGASLADLSIALQQLLEPPETPHKTK